MTALLDALADVPTARRRILVTGRPTAVASVRWPDDADVVEAAGWQRADMALAAAYSPGDDPLVLVSGDGDFGLLAARHAGPVLVVSAAASARLRESATVVDPLADGSAAVRGWLTAVGVLADRGYWPT